MLTKSRIVQLLFMMVVLLSLFVWRTLNDAETATEVDTIEEPPLVNLLRCDYVQACEFITEHGTYFLAINNLPLQVEEWIDFELTLPSESSIITNAQLVAKTMFMGRIPVKFKAASELMYQAKGIVGGCALDEMIWELQISVDNGGQTEVVTFDFMVKK